MCNLIVGKMGFQVSLKIKCLICQEFMKLKYEPDTKDRWIAECSHYKLFFRLYQEEQKEVEKSE